MDKVFRGGRGMADHLQRGLSAARTRNADEAARWFRKAVDEDPSNGQARAWLGQALCAAGHRLEGTRHLGQAGDSLLAMAEDGAGTVAPLLDIIIQLQHWGDVAAALALCRGAAAVEADNPRLQELLALCCSQLNMVDEALASGSLAATLSPDQPMLKVLCASLEIDAGRLPDARARLARVLASEPRSMAGFRAHKEMARLLDKQGDYDGAFAHLESSGRLSRRLDAFQRIDHTLILRVIALNRQVYRRAVLDRWSNAAFPGRAAPVFLVGFFRSGTTLTQAVLATHPAVFVADEGDMLHETQREMHRIDPSSSSTADKIARLTRADILRLRTYYWGWARARYGAAIDRPVFVDKFTMNTVDAGFINCIFPDARMVFMVRDPRDVCLSSFMQLMVSTPATVHLHEWSTTLSFYAAVMDWWLYIRDQLTMRWTEVRYEDGVTRFEATYTALLSFLGLEWDPALHDFHTQAARKFITSPSRNQVVRPLYQSSVERWRHYRRHVAGGAEQLAPFVSAFGYPPT